MASTDFLTSPSVNELRARFEFEALPLLGRLYGAALALTGSAADAEELVQDLYERAYVSFHRLRGRVDLRSRLYRLLGQAVGESYGRTTGARPAECDGRSAERDVKAPCSGIRPTSA